MAGFRRYLYGGKIIIGRITSYPAVNYLSLYSFT